MDTTEYTHDIPQISAVIGGLMKDDGYGIGFSPSPECREDMELVERSRCADCGGMMSFVMLMRYDEHTTRPKYRAFAVCWMCDAGSEL